MKQSSTLWIALSIVALLSATAIFGATTVPAIVTKMMDVQHDFTPSLASALNPSQTGLKSSPLSGKTTGWVVTAEEYNRILEMLGQIQLTPILASWYVKGGDTDSSISKEITLDTDGVLILTGSTRSVYSEGCKGETSYTAAVTYLDGTYCSIDRSEATNACNLTLNASSTCIQPITAGTTHTLKVANQIDWNGTVRDEIRMGYVVVGASPTNPSTSTATTTTTTVKWWVSYTYYCFINTSDRWYLGAPHCPSSVTIGDQGPCDSGFTVQKSLWSWGHCGTTNGDYDYLFPPGADSCLFTHGNTSIGKAYVCSTGTL